MIVLVWGKCQGKAKWRPLPAVMYHAKINQRSSMALVADEPCQIANYGDNGLKAGLGGGA